MVSDIDAIFANLENISRTIPESSQEANMAHVINYNITPGTGWIIPTLSGNEQISQYEEVLLRVTLDESYYSVSSIYDAYTLILYFSTPSDPEIETSELTYATDEYEEQFENHYHLIPDYRHRGVFELHLNEVFNDDLVIGEVNECKFVFKLLARKKSDGTYDELHQVLDDGDPLTLEMYKTEEEYINNKDDLMNAFIVINNLREVSND